MSAKKLTNDSKDKKILYFKGAVFGIISTIIAMLLFSAVLLFSGIDRSYAAPFATISVAIGSFIASRYTAKKIGDKGYIVGIIIGVTVFAFITLLSFFINKNGLSVNTIFHFFIILLSSVIGGIVGVNKKQKKYI